MERKRRIVVTTLVAAVALTGAFALGRATAPEAEVAGTRLQSTGIEGSDDLASTTTTPTLGLDEGTTTTGGPDGPMPTGAAAPGPGPSTAAPTPTAAPAKAAPATPTTAGGAAAPAATLDPGDEVCTAPDPRGPVRGAFVGVVADDGIHEVSLDGSRDVLIPGTTPDAGSPASLQPAWSADGRRLAFIRSSATRQDRLRYASRDLYVVDLERGCTRLLTRSGGDSFDAPSWSPDGARLAYTRQSSDDRSWDGMFVETARPDGTDVVRVAGHAAEPRWAPDGSGRLALRKDQGLSVFDRGRFTVVDDTTGGAEFESWSPDATRLIYTVSVHQGIWVANSDGSGVKNLAPTSVSGSAGPNGIFWSRWSPDGARIVFAAGKTLWTIDADGSNARKVVDGTTSFLGGWWSPTGDAVLTNTDSGVVLTPVDGSPSRVVRPSGTLVAVLSRR